MFSSQPVCRLSDRVTFEISVSVLCCYKHPFKLVFVQLCIPFREVDS